MNKLQAVQSLRGNQGAAFRQILKSSTICGESTPVVFVEDVCEFTGMTSSQARAAFRGLIKKGLVVNIQPNRATLNMYVEA